MDGNEDLKMNYKQDGKSIHSIFILSSIWDLQTDQLNYLWPHNIRMLLSDVLKILYGLIIKDELQMNLFSSLQLQLTPVFKWNNTFLQLRENLINTRLYLQSKDFKWNLYIGTTLTAKEQTMPCLSTICILVSVRAHSQWQL